MRVSGLFILLFFAFSCSKPDHEKVDEDKIQKTITTFLLKHIEKHEGVIVLDSVKITSIDTLTDKGVLIMKGSLLIEELKNKLNIFEQELKIYELEKALRVYEDKTLREIKGEKLSDMEADIVAMQRKSDNLGGLIAADPRFSCI